MPKKLLLVDENLAVQKLVEHNLAGEGYAVAAVGDGLSALDLIDKLQPDLILAEFDLKGINIFRFCDKIRMKPSPKPRPLLLMISAAQSVDYDRLRASGVTDFVKKPLESAELLEKIKSFSMESVTEFHELPKLDPVAKGPGPGAGGEPDLGNIEELLGWSLPGELGKGKSAGRSETEETTRLKPPASPVRKEPEAVPPRPPESPAEAPEPMDFAMPLGNKMKPKSGPAGMSQPAAATKPSATGSSEEIANRVAREVIEKVAWEVVPALAEILIKQEIEKLKKSTPETED